MNHFTGLPFESVYDLSNATLETAVKAVQKEVRLLPEYLFTTSDLFPFPTNKPERSYLGFFECDTETATGRNREYLSLLLFRLQPGHTIKIFDTDPAGNMNLSTRG